MARRYIRTFAVNLILFGLFAEIAGLFLYYVNTGAFFDTHQRAAEQIPDTPEGRLSGDALHPYFGPTHMPGLPLQIPPELRDGTAATETAANPTGARTNNFGFVSVHDFPFVKTRSTQFVIGIFGGSVSAWFCHVGTPRLLASLKMDASFSEREIVPLCFSHEGYKQPQQLLILAYFLSIGQEFDLVINIDGFNEVALSPHNEQSGLDLSMPSPFHMEGLINLIDRSTLTPERLLVMAQIYRLREQLNGLAVRLQRTPFASMYAILDRYYASTRTRYFTELGRFSNLPGSSGAASMIRITPAVIPRDEAKVFEDIAAQWAQSSLLMNSMLAERGVPYFHFLQPNQYFTTRRFTEPERATALNVESPFKAGAEKGYPALIAAANLLTGRERFFNAVDIFNREPLPVYLDDCCHYTLTGYERLADAVSASVLRAEALWR
jgi:hypothetical protein